jgi:hypothetical protein
VSIGLLLLILGVLLGMGIPFALAAVILLSRAL